jgi:hypothetical protein
VDSLIKENNDNQRVLSYIDLVWAVVFVPLAFATGGWIGLIFVLMSVYYVWSFFKRRVINIEMALVVPMEILKQVATVERTANIRLQAKKEKYEDVMDYVITETDKIRKNIAWSKDTE